LDEQKIIPDLKSHDKKEILRELAGNLAAHEKSVDLELLVAKLIERENLSSTGIGEGIAIPHCKYNAVDRIVMSFGRSVSGLNFDSIDNRPVNLFFLLIAPNTQKAAGEHLRTLAKLTRILRSEDFKRRLLQAGNSNEILNLILEEDQKY